MAANVVRTECAGDGCGLKVVVYVEQERVHVMVPSNGRRGSLHKPAHTVKVDASDDGDLTMWDCPVCGYADSVYSDPATRKALA